MLKAKGAYHDTHTVLGGTFPKQLRYLGLELGSSQVRGIDNISRFLPQWVQHLPLIGNIFQQGIALT